MFVAGKRSVDAYFECSPRRDKRKGRSRRRCVEFARARHEHTTGTVNNASVYARRIVVRLLTMVRVPAAADVSRWVVGRRRYVSSTLRSSGSIVRPSPQLARTVYSGHGKRRAVGTTQRFTITNR